MSLAEMTTRLEKSLLEHCAPTLAGIKPASMFSFHLTCKGCAHCHCSAEKVGKREALLNMALLLCCGKLAQTGVRIEVLAWRPTGSLLYVYRADLVEACLCETRSRALLERIGYPCDSLAGCLAQLRERIGQADRAGTKGRCAFPHEVGLLLGYPYEDVAGFMESGGQGYCSAGCWKVYANERDAQECFCRYRNCTAAYRRFYEAGVPLENLALIGSARTQVPAAA